MFNNKDKDILVWINCVVFIIVIGLSTFKGTLKEGLINDIFSEKDDNKKVKVKPKPVVPESCITADNNTKEEQVDVTNQDKAKALYTYYEMANDTSMPLSDKTYNWKKVQEFEKYKKNNNIDEMLKEIEKKKYKKVKNKNYQPNVILNVLVDKKSQQNAAHMVCDGDPNKFPYPDYVIKKKKQDECEYKDKGVWNSKEEVCNKKKDGEEVDEEVNEEYVEGGGGKASGEKAEPSDPPIPPSCETKEKRKKIEALYEYYRMVNETGQSFTNRTYNLEKLYYLKKYIKDNNINEMLKKLEDKKYKGVKKKIYQQGIIIKKTTDKETQENAAHMVCDGDPNEFPYQDYVIKKKKKDECESLGKGIWNSEKKNCECVSGAGLIGEDKDGNKELTKNGKKNKKYNKDNNVKCYCAKDSKGRTYNWDIDESVCKLDKKEEE